MKHPALCVEHSGSDPVYHGGPSLGLARIIRERTDTDAIGRRYYRNYSGEWRRLITARDFGDLNWIVDRFR